MDRNINVSNSSGAASHIREAASLDDSSRTLEAQEYLSSIKKNIDDASSTLEYLRMIDADPGLLQDMSSAFDFINKSLDHVFEGVYEEERKEIANKIVANKKKKSSTDYERYLNAMQTYEAGNYKRARAVFATLSRTSLDNEVKQCSMKSVTMIDSWIASKDSEQ